MSIFIESDLSNQNINKRTKDIFYKEIKDDIVYQYNKIYDNYSCYNSTIDKYFNKLINEELNNKINSVVDLLPIIDKIINKIYYINYHTNNSYLNNLIDLINKSKNINNIYNILFDEFFNNHNLKMLDYLNILINNYELPIENNSPFIDYYTKFIDIHIIKFLKSNSIKEICNFFNKIYNINQFNNNTFNRLLCYCILHFIFDYCSMKNNFLNQDLWIYLSFDDFEYQFGWNLIHKISEDDNIHKITEDCSIHIDKFLNNENGKISYNNFDHYIENIDKYYFFLNFNKSTKLKYEKNNYEFYSPIKKIKNAVIDDIIKCFTDDNIIKLINLFDNILINNEFENLDIYVYFSSFLLTKRTNIILNLIYDNHKYIIPSNNQYNSFTKYYIERLIERLKLYNKMSNYTLKYEKKCIELFKKYTNDECFDNKLKKYIYDMEENLIYNKEFKNQLKLKNNTCNSLKLSEYQNLQVKTNTSNIWNITNENSILININQEMFSLNLLGKYINYYNKWYNISFKNKRKLNTYGNIGNVKFKLKENDISVTINCNPIQFMIIDNILKNLPEEKNEFERTLKKYFNIIEKELYSELKILIDNKIIHLKNNKYIINNLELLDSEYNLI